MLTNDSPHGDDMGIDAKLAALGIVLPTPPAPVAAYVGAVRTGNLIVTSGQLPTIDGKLVATGKVPGNTSAEAAKAAARVCCINCLAQVKAVAGSLDRIRRIVRLEGFVNSSPGFTAHAGVMNGASDLLLELFGEAGKHARTTVGVAELPLDAAIEVGMWAEVE